MRNLFLVLFLTLFIFNSNSQNKEPKLIVGIVVDQMRYDYLYKFQSNYGEGGFQKLMSEGFVCHNVNYNYKPTYTGPGHASIFTGNTPSIHGIVGNNWYDRTTNKNVYCVLLTDSLGNTYESPERLLSETFSDGLKQFTNFQSKSYGISLKDRGAILPVGHLANAAFWFNSEKGLWESSNYYKEQDALKGFNKNNFSSYLKNGWKLSLPIDKYEVSLPDSNNYEHPLSKSSKPEFPYNLMEIQKEIGWGILKKIPQGNDMTADAAKYLIKNKNLGKGEVTDFISISFSATDYVGHRFGVQSLEVHDTYVKLDQTLASLISFLDTELGKEEYVLFLTSDHGAGMPINYLKDKGLPHGSIDERELLKGLRKELKSKLGNDNWVTAWINLNVYFNDSLKKAMPEEFIKAKSVALAWLNLQEGIAQAFDVESSNSPIQELSVNGYLPYLSGDLICIEKPNWTTYTKKGSTHGSGYKYDTHVPLIFYGKNVHQGETFNKYPITSIVPTVSAISKIPVANTENNLIIIESLKSQKP